MRNKISRIRIPENLTELAYKSIRESIVSGELTAEDRLSEEGLATQLGISKSPVREALNRLAVEGLVEISPRRGTRVVQFGPDEVTEIFDLREALEILAVKLLRVTPQFLSELSAIVERCEILVRNGERKNFVLEDLCFHDRLVQASENRFLLRMFRNLQDYIQLVRLKSVVLPGRPDRSQKEHRQIVQALKRGDLPSVERLLREHIRDVKTDVLRSFQQAAVAASAKPSRSRNLKRCAVRF